MNSQLATDLVIHLQDTGYNNTSDINPVINYLKGRGVEPTDSVINHAKRLIFINF